MKETCEELGIELGRSRRTDPTAMPSPAQQFITEDVPRQIATYGKDTAFFSTNCAMQEPLFAPFGKMALSIHSNAAQPLSWLSCWFEHQR